MPETLRNLYLVIAQDCNLACTYCYAAGGDFGQRRRHMDSATMRLAMERLLPLAGERLTLSFFGGEPLLNFPLLCETLDCAGEMAKASGRSLSFALTTNGTVLDEDMLEVIATRIDHLAISLDGGPLANAGRVFADGTPAYAAILANIGRLAERGVAFALRATVTPANVGSVLETAAFLAGLGAASLRLLPAQGVIWPPEARRRLRHALVELNRRGLRALFAGEPPQACEHALRLLAHRLDGEATTRPCLAGGGILAVGADGTVYPCEHFVGVAEMAMGRVDSPDFPGARFAAISSRFANCTTWMRPRCASCPAAAACGGQCYAESWLAGGGIERPAPDHCARVLEILRSLEPEVERGLADPATAGRLRQMLGV